MVVGWAPWWTGQTERTSFLTQGVASRGKTKPRTLRLLPCDDWATQWQLAEQYAPDRLPPMRVGPLWNKLRQDCETKGEKLVPYSCRHGYAHQAHLICADGRGR